ncbi:MAG: TonB-dependent receptor plug domain-containing protein [Bacteroidota bacterium]
MQKTSFIIYWILSLSISAFGQDAIQDPIELKELTSASSAKLDQKDFNKGVIHSPYQLFNGRMTGLGMSGLGNDPNGEFLLRVRGLSTLQIHTGPLLIVDGFITDNLLIVDPKDIEQITLLKDAASASIYGVQGGNGVLLISTKKGNDQPLSFSFNTTFGIEKPLHNIAPASSSEYKSYPGSVDLGSSTNWLDKITQNGISNVNSLAISGGSKAFSIRASINYRKANGTLTGTGFDQVNSRINMQQKALQDKLLLQKVRPLANYMDPFLMELIQMVEALILI